MASRLTLLSGTNHIPTESELLEIEQLAAPDNAKLAQLEIALQEAEARVAGLKKEREAMFTRVRPFRALGSLIRRFSQEIMECIFIHSRPGVYSTFSPSDSPFGAPTCLQKMERNRS